MNVSVEKMNEKIATEIVGWKYTAPYDFYNNEQSDESIKELLEGSYYALVNQNKEIVGFFCIGTSAQVPAGNQYEVYKKDFVDMGLGMNPKLIGHGNGFRFCKIVLTYIEVNYKDIPIRLTVAKFNERAIHLYKKLGFVKQNEFNTDYAEFITMVKTNCAHCVRNDSELS